MVSASGQVLATVFAAITGASGSLGRGGFAVPNALVAHQLALASSHAGAVSTGPCAG
jgi:hypothetical protein